MIHQTRISASEGCAVLACRCLAGEDLRRDLGCAAVPLPRLLHLLLPLLLLVALGCGSENEDLSLPSDGPFAGLLARTEGAATAAFALQATVAAEGAGVRTSAEGVVDFASGRGRMSIAIPRLDGDEPRPGIPGALTLLFERDRLYLEVPDVLRDRTDGRPWVTVSGLAGGFGLGLGGSHDPTRLVALIESATDAERLGEETVRGVPAVRYRVRLDPERAVARAEVAERHALRAVARIVGDAPIDLWVDADALPRRVSFTSGAGGAASRLQVEFFDFGTGVSVSLPGADTVYHAGPEDLARLLSRL